MVCGQVLLLLAFSIFGLAKTAPNVPQLRNMSNDDLEEKLQSLFDSFFEKGKTEEFEETLRQIETPYLFRMGPETQEIRKGVICTACRTAITSLITARRLGTGRNVIFNFLTTLCQVLRIESKPVCDGVIDRQLDAALYIVDNGKDITGRWVCSVLLQGQRCKQPAEKNWKIEVDSGYSAPMLDEESSSTTKILQITDFHYDENYKPGSNAICDLPVCCSEDSGKPSDASSEAGYWGDYRNCDTPLHSIVNAFEHAKVHQEVSLVYFTGDIVDHRVWKTERENNIKYFKQLCKLLDDYFGKTGVYPVLGNHEPHPVNLFAPENVDKQFSTQWIFDIAAEEWSRWLPQSALETVRKGGYYTVKISDRFRIIALNSNVCYILNLWLLYDHVDMYDQLKWFRDVLKEAEANKEYVHILSHVPTGSLDCHRTWAREFRRIVNRYANNIKAIFNGHTHTNEFQLFYNTSNSAQPVAIAFNGGSITSYNFLNTNYMIYEADSITKEIKDAKHYTYNLTAANLKGSDTDPDWYELYSFSKVYGTKMDLDSIHRLVERMAGDKSLALLYYRNKYKNSDPYVIDNDCDDECISENLCEIVTSVYGDYTQCNVLNVISEARYDLGN